MNNSQQRIEEMAKKIEMVIECPSCKGAGVFAGMGEGQGAAVVCSQCEGSGAYKYEFHYHEFTGKKIRDDIERVYLKGCGYKIGTGVIDFGEAGAIDMDKEGVSYKEFLAGAMPDHIKALGCPMMADQGACHKIGGFVDECMKLNGGWIGMIPRCANQCNKADCWRRFNEELV